MARTEANSACFVRLRNGEFWIAKNNGWNPGEEMEMLGPIGWDLAKAIEERRANLIYFIWTINTDEIIGYSKVFPERLNPVVYQAGWKSP